MNDERLNTGCPACGAIAGGACKNIRGGYVHEQRVLAQVKSAKRAYKVGDLSTRKKVPINE